MNLLRLPALLLLFVAGAAQASEADVRKLMEDYWRAYSRSDFVAAAAYLDPRDLEALREGLVPLFLRAAESKNVNVQPLAQAFYAGIPAARREDMTAPQVFAGMNRMMRDVMPQVFDALKRTAIQVTKVTLAGDGTAVIAYTIRHPDYEASDVERANLHEGRWFLRSKDSPAVTIERFRMLLGLDYEMGPEVKLSPTDEP